MKPSQLGPGGVVCLAVLILALHCQLLHAQDGATTAPDNAVTDTSKSDPFGELADANDAVAHNPNFAPAYEDRGLVKMRQGDLNGAIADFSHAIEISPKNTSFYVDRAEAKKKNNVVEFE
jgi:tetratricopeptide (TPR) repeat protein